jgi:hypothetical protein
MRNTGPELESVARPKQARSEQTLQRILDAAEGLIEEKGLADASIPEIVRRAGSSVGGFCAWSDCSSPRAPPARGSATWSAPSSRSWCG